MRKLGGKLVTCGCVLFIIACAVITGGRIISATLGPAVSYSDVPAPQPAQMYGLPTDTGSPSAASSPAPTRTVTATVTVTAGAGS